MAIILNRIKGHAVTSDVANAAYVLTDFATPNASYEAVTGLTISKIFWTGDWTIKRGSSVIWQTANNTGAFDLRAAGIYLPTGNSSNLSVNTTSSSASIILELGKISTTTVDPNA
jgi:hypothetical protein